VTGCEEVLPLQEQAQLQPMEWAAAEEIPLLPSSPSPQLATAVPPRQQQRKHVPASFQQQCPAQPATSPSGSIAPSTVGRLGALLAACCAAARVAAAATVSAPALHASPAQQAPPASSPQQPPAAQLTAGAASTAAGTTTITAGKGMLVVVLAACRAVEQAAAVFSDARTLAAAPLLVPAQPAGDVQQVAVQAAAQQQAAVQLAGRREPLLQQVVQQPEAGPQ